MELFYRLLGLGDPVVILHGLYGASDNWHSIGRELSRDHSVYLIDQRNHGNSPHDPVHNYNVLSNDLYEFLDKHKIDKPVIIGHSMGGKTALAFGLKYPERVRKMIVVDISPLGYENRADSSETTNHEKIILALQAMDPDHIANRGDADKQLEQSIPSSVVRQFLLKNLKRTPDGKFRWAMNIQALAENMPSIFAGVLPGCAANQDIIPRFPLLFLKGERSGYIGITDEEAIRHYFPWAEVKIIQDTGHWIHAEQPDEFLKAVRSFIGIKES